MLSLVQAKGAHSKREAGMRELGMCHVVLFVQNIFYPLLQGPSLVPLYWKSEFPTARMSVLATWFVLANGM